MLAAYNLAMLQLGGHTPEEQAPCQAAAALLKSVAERGFPALEVSELLHCCREAADWGLGVQGRMGAVGCGGGGGCKHSKSGAVGRCGIACTHQPRGKPHATLLGTNRLRPYCLGQNPHAPIAPWDNHPHGRTNTLA